MRSEGYCSWVCLSVCLCVRYPKSHYRPTNDTTYLTGNEGQNICGIFSETAAFVSYGVKQKLKSRYANERWAYLDQIPAPFRAGGVSEVTCRIRAMSKSYLLAAGVQEPASSSCPLLRPRLRHMLRVRLYDYSQIYSPCS